MPRTKTGRPYFPDPPKEYDQKYFADIVRAFAQYTRVADNPGELRATRIVVTDMPTSSTGLEPGTLYLDGETVKSSSVSAIAIASSQMSALVSSVLVQTPTGPITAVDIESASEVTTSDIGQTHALAASDVATTSNTDSSVTLSVGGSPPPPVLFGNAPWNVPVSQVSRLSASSEALRVQELCDQPQYNASQQSGWNLRQDQYTYPVYYASEASGTYEVNVNNSESGINGTFIPFNPSWQAAPGTDAQIIIYDESTGECWDIWQYTGLNGSNQITGSRCNRIQGPINSPSTNSDADMRTRENGFRPSRGVGIQYLAMLIMPWEIEQGLIEHALSMPSPNTAHSGGFGYTSAGYVPPATKPENSGTDAPDRVVVEGTRYSLQKTNAQIDAFLATFPGDVPASTRAGVRAILVAMRDYGWFITDTSGACGFQMECYISCDWAALGMRDFTASNGKVYPRDALDGILTQSDMRAYVPSNTSSPWY